MWVQFGLITEFDQTQFIEFHLVWFLKEFKWHRVRLGLIDFVGKFTVPVYLLVILTLALFHPRSYCNFFIFRLIFLCSEQNLQWCEIIYLICNVLYLGRHRRSGFNQWYFDHHYSVTSCSCFHWSLFTRLVWHILQTVRFQSSSVRYNLHLYTVKLTAGFEIKKFLIHYCVYQKKPTLWFDYFTSFVALCGEINYILLLKDILNASFLLHR